MGTNRDRLVSIDLKVSREGTGSRIIAVAFACLLGCSAGPDEPAGILIASDQAQPTSIAVDDTHAYWVSRGDNSIWRAPKQGGVPVRLASTQVAPSRLAVAGAYVYWTLGTELAGESGVGAIMTVPKDGGTTRPLLDDLAFSDRLVVVDETIYWGGRTAAFSVPVAGDEQPREVLTGELLADIGLGGDVIYAVETCLCGQPFARLITAPLDGGASRTVASVSSISSGGLIIDGDTAYWAANGPGEHGVYRTDVADGTTTRLADTPASEMAADDEFIYWTSGLVVFAKAKDTPGALPVAEGAESLGGIAADGNAVFWTVPDAGEVWTATKAELAL